MSKKFYLILLLLSGKIFGMKYFDNKRYDSLEQRILKLKEQLTPENWQKVKKYLKSSTKSSINKDAHKLDAIALGDMLLENQK